MVLCDRKAGIDRLSSVLKREILVALLGLTSGEPAAIGNLHAAVRVTDDVFNEFLDQLSFEGLIAHRGGLIEASQRQRLEMAVRAVQLGADFQRVCCALGWLEFEEMVSFVFEENGYDVSRRFRFTAETRRWEIDVLATRRPLVVCCECKHWAKGLGKAIAKKTVETHLEKIRVFSENIVETSVMQSLKSWSRAVVVPMVMSLMPTPIKLFEQVPIVSILALPNFLNKFDGYLDKLAKHTVELPPPKPSPSQTVLRRR